MSTLVFWRNLIDEYRKAEDGSWQRRWWNRFADFYEEGDKFVRYRTWAYSGYILFRGDRRVWEMEDCHYHMTGISLR
jgi:hypothetical protein